MKCPYCSSASSVTNSRKHRETPSVWRRRQCENCKSIWSTSEKYDLSTTHRVMKPAHNDLQPFNRDKLLFSLNSALRHRKTALADASALTDTVISKLLALNSPIIETSDIKHLSVVTLQAYDETSAQVYKAMY